MKRPIDNNGELGILEAPNKVAKVADTSERGWTVTRGPQIIEISGRSCQHEVAWPGVVEDEKAFLPPAKSKNPPAKQYPFPLDPFQQTAINCLEAGASYSMIQIKSLLCLHFCYSTAAARCSFSARLINIRRTAHVLAPP